MIKTETGRVVYNRPTHFFTLKDAARIVEKAPRPATISEYFETWKIILSVIFLWGESASVHIFGNENLIRDSFRRVVSLIIDFWIPYEPAGSLLDALEALRRQI